MFVWGYALYVDCFQTSESFNRQPNQNSDPKNGNGLENLVHLAVIFASCRNGLKPMSFVEFMAALTREFNKKDSTYLELDPECDLAKMIPR